MVGNMPTIPHSGTRWHGKHQHEKIAYKSYMNENEGKVTGRPTCLESCFNASN